MSGVIRGALQRVSTNLVPYVGKARVRPNTVAGAKNDSISSRISNVDVKTYPIAVVNGFLLRPTTSKPLYKLPGFKAGEVIYTAPFGYSHINVYDKMLPCVIIRDKLDPARGVPEVKDPVGPGRSQEKHAARLIIIRRKKMKKHKLRKLRKRMYYVWAKIRQRREARKEKAFIDEQLTRIDTSEDFKALEWVEDMLRRSSSDPADLIKSKPRLPRPTRYVIK